MSYQLTSAALAAALLGSAVDSPPPKVCPCEGACVLTFAGMGAVAFGWPAAPRTLPGPVKLSSLFADFEQIFPILIYARNAAEIKSR